MIRQPDRHYPAVYVLSGYLGDHRAYVGHFNTTMQAFTGADLGIDLGSIVPELLANGGMGELIIVLPDCMNIYGISTFGRSEAIGDYRGYIAEDLVGYIDAQYRTIPDREHRGITGHSSGAYGAISLAMEYPDVFGSVAALGPVNLVDRQRETALLEYMELNPDSHGEPTLVSSDTRDEDMWDIWMGTIGTTIIYAIAAGFSPNSDNPPYYVDIPVTYTDGTAALDEDLWAQWVEQDLLSQIERDGANLSDTPIIIVAGLTSMGEKPGIDLILTALHGHGISYEYDGFPGGHSDYLRYELTSALRFLSSNIGAIPIGDFSNTFFVSLEPGLNMLSLPLKPMTPYTARSLAEEIGATAVIMYDTILGKFVGFTPAASGEGFVLNGGEGYIVNVPTGGTVAFTGAAWTNDTVCS